MSQVKEFSNFLCMGRCKSLGSMKSFLWYHLRSLGPVSCVFLSIFFKVFIEFVTILCLFYVYVLVFWLLGTWDLSSLTRAGTHPTLPLPSWKVKSWPPGHQGSHYPVCPLPERPQGSPWRAAAVWRLMDGRCSFLPEFPQGSPAHPLWWLQHWWPWHPCLLTGQEAFHFSPRCTRAHSCTHMHRLTHRSEARAEGDSRSCSKRVTEWAPLHRCSTEGGGWQARLKAKWF